LNREVMEALLLGKFGLGWDRDDDCR